MTNISTSQYAACWVQAYSSHDLDSLMSCYDDHAVNVQHSWGREVFGKAAIRSIYERTFSGFPDITIRLEDLIADSVQAVIQWEFSGTMLGKFAEYEPTGRLFQLRGCEILRFSDRKIVKQSGYWDRASLFTQLGLPT